MTTPDAGLRHRVAAAAALTFGAAIGTYEIANTSIGWHLAAGRWILEERRIPRQDFFSFTAHGTDWIDHEWLFQLLLAGVEQLGGEPGLVVLRTILVAALTLGLFVIGRRSGLSPPAALLLAALCSWGARIRFYLRPELFTLLIVPAALWIFLNRDSPRWSRAGPWAVAAMMAIGINLHGAVLVVPVLMAGVLSAEILRDLGNRQALRRTLGSGAGWLAAASCATLINPFGWRVLGVPLHLAFLTSLPQVPNPEWFTPTPLQLPSLYVAMAGAALLLIVGERDPRRWMLLLMASLLAVRYARNVGIFFVVLPLIVAPAFARAARFARDQNSSSRSRQLLPAALVVCSVLAVAVWLEPQHRLHLGLSEDRYPAGACRFLEAEGLLATPLYNEVRFGGYLIQRYYPPQQVFIDDRNEIHIELLTEMHHILQASDVGAWQGMLDRYAIGAALLRYNPPVMVESPDGRKLGYRGFSTLWFPASRWALVYWDATAMVLVKRAVASPALLARAEYGAIRPDDMVHLLQLIAEEPRARPAIARELERALLEQPDNERARELARALLASGGP